MELSSKPLSFNNGVLRTRFVPFSKTPKASFLDRSVSSNSFNNGTTNDSSRRSAVSAIKASKTTPSSRPTLSSNWDMNFAAEISSPPWLPRFEELDPTNMLLRQRIVFLGSQVDDTTADFVISQLLLLDAEDSTKDIKLFINSPGGSITAGMGIYDAMKLCKADISTVCLGLAASMGAFLLATGTKGKRFCMPNSRVMIHQPLGMSGGTATDMSIRIREMCYHKVKLNKIFSRVTGKPFEQLDADTARDFFMSPWEAKDYGLIDEVIDDGKPGLVAPTTDITPPGKSRVSDLWKVEGSRKARRNLPSEIKILEKGYNEGQSEKETPTPV